MTSVVTIFQGDISDTDSSVSEGDVKRRRTLHYFGGDGNKKWQPQTMLTLDGMNVAKILEKFRRKNIILAEEISTVSLSHVFTVDKFNDDRCITVYYDTLKSPLYKFAYKDIIIDKASASAVYYYKEVTDAMDDNEDTETIAFCPTSSVDAHIKAVALQFIEDATHSSKSESTFTEKHVVPFVKALLKKTCLTYSVFDAVDDKSDTKPDVMIGFKIRRSTTYWGIWWRSGIIV
ncbi:hypothetical protein MBANPS3_009531 [Mucor bainieri]